MNNVLFIKANDRDINQAVSVKLYYAFLDNYREHHPDDNIVELDLFKEHLPYLNADMINGNYKASRGMEMTYAEQEANAIATRYLDQFLAADIVVIGFPMWNMTIPAVLHTYIDYLNQAGKTFRYTADGPIGLATGKKVVLLTARGGVYSEGAAAEAEMAHRYVDNIMRFFGITDIVSIIVEGHNEFPDQAEALIARGIKDAIDVAAVI